MWFDEVGEIQKIAKKSGTSIFVLPDEVEVEILRAIVLRPEEKTTISIEQIRGATAGLGLKQTEERFIIVRPAEKLGIEAANALLKNLEEPSERVHYVLITSSAKRLLPTIRSRAAVYYLRLKKGLDLEIVADDSNKALAKQLITARPTDLPQIAEGIAKKKPARTAALEILGLTIEMLYKSYFITGKMVFLQKIPKFLTAYENIQQNGHVKLHLVADLI